MTNTNHWNNLWFGAWNREVTMESVQVSESVYLDALTRDGDTWREADASAESINHHFARAISLAWLAEDDRLLEQELADERAEADQERQDALGGFNWSPMGYHNPCAMDGPHGRMEAQFAVAGREPDNRGGGILFWAYTIREAEQAKVAYEGAGYHNVHIEPN